MNNYLRIITRRVGAVTLTKSTPANALRCISTQVKPPVGGGKCSEDDDMRLMAGYAEYLDSMLSKTSEIQDSVQDLKETYEKKKQLKLANPNTVKWMDADEIDKLFDQAGKQKQDIESKLAELRMMIEGAKKAYAVDAPDGDSDGHIQEELKEIEHIIEEAAEHAHAKN